MGLSRLSNFLKSVKGNIIYVDPNSLDATDSTENQGNSLTRPFKTLQRALIEAARFSYQKGNKNDRFLKTTILLYPGEHYVDNRPGWIPIDNNIYQLRSGAQQSTTEEEFSFDFRSNFDVFDATNDLYKLNSVYGGVIVPRGTSIVGFDLRKTKIRPLYVPSPINDNIDSSAIFRVTGGCYFWQFTIFDGDPNGKVYRDFTGNKVVPNFSHHKLTVFEYADGVNDVEIDDIFLTYSTPRTDLEIYYEKIALAYGPSTREIEPDPSFPVPTGVDIEPVVDEFRVVGSKGLEVGISSIRSGNGVDIGTTDITVFLDESIDSLSVDTAIQISNVTDDDYNGQYAISEVVSDTIFKYQVPTIPVLLNPSTNGSTVNIVVDTVSSASPYVFNCSLRSVWGMCGLHADGSKATGFRSMVVAQYTGIGLQKDERAFVKYNEDTGLYQDFQELENLQTDSRSRFKPDWENYHIKGSNNAFLQLVSVFAIGFANHFLAESGGDYSITNSNSNFGARALVSKGFRDSSFDRDDCGYITHVVTPKTISSSERNVEYLPIDVVRTLSGLNPEGAARLYLANEFNPDELPLYITQGYRVGASLEDLLFVELLNNNTGEITKASTPIVMEGTEGGSGTNDVGQKKYRVDKDSQGNKIENNILTFTDTHFLNTGESVIVISDDGSLPDGLVHNRVYFVIRQTGTTIKLAISKDEALAGNFIVLNKRGGNLDIISRVTDKVPGDVGHPVQYDSTSGVNQWYIQCDVNENNIFDVMTDLNSSGSISNTTPKTFFKRIPDNRTTGDKIYKLRYVLPKENTVACRPPLEGYVLQESSNTTGTSVTIPNYITFSNSTNLITNPTNQRNFKFIAYASWSSSVVTVRTEIPHNLSVGTEIQIYDIISSLNTEGTYKRGYNGQFVVSKVLSRKEFQYALVQNPGTFSNTNASQSRTVDLPRVVNTKYTTTFQIFRSEIIQEYVFGEQDGIYHLILTNTSNSPQVSPYQNNNFSQPIQNLYPQYDRDNPNSDPDSSSTIALSNPIGQTVVNDFKRSITKETLDKFIVESKVGFGITDISSETGIAHTIYTSIEHGLSGVTNLAIQNSGSNYAPGEYYNVRLNGTNTGQNATAAIRVETGGTIDDVVVIDGGSAYQVGDLLSVEIPDVDEGLPENVGVATASSFDKTTNAAVLRVTAVNDNVNDVIRFTGISSHVNAIEEYNGYYRITSVEAGKIKEFNVESSKTIVNIDNTGIGTEAIFNSYYTNIGKSYGVNSLTYDSDTGEATVGLTTSHAFRNGSKALVYNADNSFYNGEYEVQKIAGSVDNIIIKYNVKGSNPSPGVLSNIVILPTGYTDANQSIENDNEFKSSRIVPLYDNFTSTLVNSLGESSSNPLEVYDSLQGGLTIGDYLLVNDEIVRISERVTDNSFNIIRGLLGTKKQTHSVNSIVRRIYPRPVETRRNSIIRASGHTFEYLGFGPGNYSTSLPERQDRILSPQEDVLAQSFREEGGTALYTGMNSDGDLYNNNKKLTSNGQDQLFDSPIPTVTGEEPAELFADGGYNLVTPAEVTVSRSIKVEGGPEGNIVSEINGPLVINEKMTSTSDEGIEIKNLNLRGELEVSRSIGISTVQPTQPGNVSDISFNAFAAKNSNLGWIYTTEDKWEQFGWVNDALYGADFKFLDPFKGPSSFNASRGVEFQAGNGVAFIGPNNTYPIEPDSESGITTVILSVSASIQNSIGIRTGTLLPDGDGFTDYTAGGGAISDPDSNDADTTQIIKFATNEEGFGVRVSTIYDSVAGVTTVFYNSPIVPLNFGSGIVPLDGPSIGAERSTGTRIVFEDTFVPGATDFAIGLDGPAPGDPRELWFTLPNTSNPQKSFRWYAGTTDLLTLTNQRVMTLGQAAFPEASSLKVYGDVEAFNLSLLAPNGTEPISIASSTRISNLNANYLYYDNGVESPYGIIPDKNNNVKTIPVREDVPGVGLLINAAATQLVAAGSPRDGSYFVDIESRLGYTPFDNSGGDTSSEHSTFRVISDYYQYKIDGDIPTSGADANKLIFDFERGPLGYWKQQAFNSPLSFKLNNVPTATSANGKVTSQYDATTREGKAFNFTWVIDTISGSATQVPSSAANFEINGSVVNSLRWLNGNAPSGSLDANKIYLIGLTIFFDINNSPNNGWTVLGVFSEYT